MTDRPTCPDCLSLARVLAYTPAGSASEPRLKAWLAEHEPKTVASASGTSPQEADGPYRVEQREGICHVVNESGLICGGSWARRGLAFDGCVALNAAFAAGRAAERERCAGIADKRAEKLLESMNYYSGQGDHDAAENVDETREEIKSIAAAIRALD